MRHALALPQFVRDLLSSPPRRGGGLNRWFYRVARLLHPYRDSVAIIELLRAATAGELVKHGEIERAVERSRATAWMPGQLPRAVAPAWPKPDQEKRAAVIAASAAGLVDLWEISPHRFEDNASHCEEVIDALFPGNPLLCAGCSNSNFATRSCDEWRGKLASLQFIVPNPMTARFGRTRDGKRSAHALETTGQRRFLVIEQDSGSIDDQAAILLHLAERAPLVIAVHSGGKSIHGWFFAAGQPEEKLRRFMSYAVSLGGDSATWTRSQFVRMPDGERDNGKPQRIFFFNPGVFR
jgi:glutathione S-transferase